MRRYKIDVLFVCNPKGGTKVRLVPFSEMNEQARIYMKSGDARGGVTINDRTGEVTVQMNTPFEDQVEFRRWKNKGRVRVIE